ncbi:serine hydrolase domain-containing protein [Rhizobium sp.]|jgi:CubicO group peptidase (beta-lactamase class C family)|uniref:serine hydrolase domain-containing protein n=1 Tax=Rhizobium sp. TaxID=391 RepID=UPI000E819E37|nr:esterase [Rhizobium sp.]
MSIADRVNRMLDQAVAEQRVVGAVVYIYQNGQPVLRRAAGFADREAGLAMRLDHIFRFASVTKPFVAATALAMVDAGLLALDDLVATHLSWFHPKTPEGQVGAITIRHLLTHTSGMTYDSALQFLPSDRAINLGLADSDITLEENFRRYNDVTLSFAPGEKWMYSCATDVLGGVVAKVHGGTLEEAVVHYITAPLRLRDARFHVTDESRLATAYRDGKPQPERMPDPWIADNGAGWRATFSPSRIFNPKAYQSGGAGMVGTAEDVLTLLETLRTGGGSILSPHLTQAGWNNQIGDVPMETPGQRFGYFGAVITDPKAAGTALPAGAIQWGGVYGNTWFVDPKAGLTVVSMTNTALEGCMGHYQELLRGAVYNR